MNDAIKTKMDLVKISAYTNFVLWSVVAFLWCFGYPIPKMLLFLAIVS